MNHETLCQRMNKRLAQMKHERTSYESHWRELAESFAPRLGRFITRTSHGRDQQRGSKKNQHIINSSPLYAVRVLVSGMMSGNTSPARPWFRLSTPDPDMAEWGPVKEWLHIAERRMRDIHNRSNLYRVLPNMYRDMAVFGPSCTLALPSKDRLVRFQRWEIGSYWMAQDKNGIVDTAYREFPMTVRQMVQEFGLEKCSLRVQNMFKNGQYETWVDICQAVEPNKEQWRSAYWESGNKEQLLADRFFTSNPIIGPRWDVDGEEVYGSSPGMVALGDARSLQLKEIRKQEAHDIINKPPLQGPSSLRNERVSLIPGDISYLDVMQGMQGLEPIHKWQPNVQVILEDIAKTEELIDDAFYVSLFLMMANDRRSNVTATEVAERHEEKLLMLGPVVERLNDELNRPIVDRTFDAMIEQSMPFWSGAVDGNPILPPPPEELQDVDLKVEFVSVLAQAQKLAGVSAQDNFMAFVGGIAGMKPDVLDKVDFDQSIDERADILGIPPNLVVPDEEVAEIRKQRAQQQQAMEMAAMAQQAGQTARDMSQTDLESENLLSRVLG